MKITFQLSHGYASMLLEGAGEDRGSQTPSSSLLLHRICYFTEPVFNQEGDVKLSKVQ